MADLRASVFHFAVRAERAAAQARETHAYLDSKGATTKGSEGVVLFGCEKLKLNKDAVLDKWMRAVKGTVHGPTLFGADVAAQANFSDLFDALVCTLESKADPPNDAELISFCARLMPHMMLSPKQMHDTVQAVLLFEEAATNVLKDHREATVRDDLVELDIAIQRILLRAEDCLKAANTRISREGTIGLSMLLAEARVSFGDARDMLLEALDNVRSFVPKAVPFQAVDDMNAIKTMTDKAIEMEQVAERLRLLAGQVTKGTAIDKAATENKRNDIRVALVSMLRQQHEQLSDRWLRTIVQRVPGYRSAAPADSVSNLEAEQVSKDINKRLVASMIERLRPGGDAAALVYAAQRLVEMRFTKMKIDAVQAATKLFEDVCMEMYHEMVQQGTYSKEFLPLIHADQADIRALLTDVIFLANKLIISEYNIRMARDQDPRLPGRLLVRAGLAISPVEIRSRIRELLVGAEIAGQYRLDTYIMAGGFGHGWRGTDLQTAKEVFVKTFKSEEEFGSGAETVVAKMVEELETAERIMKVQRLMNHRNVVSVVKVPRNATITVPSTGQQGDCFHGIVTEYCDGGELFNYIVLPKESGGLQGCAFNEKQARFLFKQIIDLLMVLHHPAEGEGDAYYHGDIKDQNFVVASSTLKLIDYGTLSKVCDNVGPVKHMTRSHQQPFHNNCESVDLWAAGIVLLDMLLISSVGQMFKVSMGVNRGVAELKAGKFWEKIQMKLKASDPHNCLLHSGPDTAKDLLQKIFQMEPANSLCVKDIAVHPWLRGDVPSEDDMERELKRRFKGILQGAPRGTAFFDLGKTTEENAEEIMTQVIELACRSSNGEFVKGGPGKKIGSIYIHRWERTSGDVETAIDRMYDDAAQWVVAKYLCNVEKSDFDLTKGRNVVRIRLFWESGSQHEDFCRLSGAILNEVMKMRLV